ncbi:META domain-containing protein [Niabella hibiscisoli]|uniref:META domain-containing protein n=1 Tax=Niabella hibiscisoli TaxID=1825928 RepID=UPI001F0E1846|nr:META domain-containing protein [Niabella hibiscisoli]MCH5717617.1 META domain-containing protein [Niabella hibiscisoli]
MKRHYFLYVLLFAMVIVIACSSPQKTSVNNSGESGNVIIPNADAKSFQNELAGTWSVVSMRRQQKADLEMLSGVTLQFNASDTKFSGKAPCNSIFGTIQLNGYSIRFQNIGATKMACDKLEQETIFIDLLQTRVSAFTLEGNKLYLRDGISNIVFTCERSQ